MKSSSAASLAVPGPARGLSRLAAWPDRDATALVRALLLMIGLPLVLGVTAWLGNLAFGGISTGNPVVTALASVVRFVSPSTRSDSWAPMIRAFDFIRGPHGDTLYATLFFGLHEKFQYPPTSLLWIDGLAHLIRIDTTTLNWVNAGVFLLNIAGSIMLCRELVRRGVASSLVEQAPVRLAILVGALCFVFWPVVYGFTIGQIQLWIDCLFTGSLLLWSKDRKIAAGIAIGLACTIKPQLGLLLPLALLWREQHFATGLAATIVTALLVSVARYGVASHIHYLDVLSYLSRHGESFRANQSVNGLMNRLLSNGDNLHWHADDFPPFLAAVYWPTLLSGLLLAAIPFALALLKRHRRPGLIDLSIGGLCFTMASPIAWEQHYGIVLPIYIVAVCMILSRRPASHSRVALGLLIASWCLVGSNLQILNLLSTTWLNVLQSYVFIGALLLLGVLVSISGPVAQDRIGHAR